MIVSSTWSYYLSKRRELHVLSRIEGAKLSVHRQALVAHIETGAWIQPEHTCHLIIERLCTIISFEK
jgi:hypothetical protein